jgi:uncharacterized protein (UPF0333 family)
MRDSSSPPGALSIKEFKLAATEVGQWLWGTVQGAFNEKQTVSQIITDAVIGMIPLVGDVTAARDLIAIGSGLANDPRRREETAEWVLLVILIFALIPVVGGVIKGVGRLALKVANTSAANSKLAAQVAADIVHFLNRIGHKNAEAWFKSLNVISYQSEILSKFRAFCDVFIVTTYRYGLRFHSVLPQSFVARMEQLSHSFEQLKVLGEKMIPQALRELHSSLQQLQMLVRSGGKPLPSRSEVMLAQTGQKTVTYVEEARLLEGKTAKLVRHAGKYPQNLAPVSNAKEISKVYKYEPGFPNLLDRVSDDGIYYPKVAAASGRISNEMLSGTTVYRSFGPAGITHGVPVGESYPIGAFWGIGPPPSAASEWRGPAAVLDEWNHNGYLCIMHIPSGVKVPACTSTVSEQYSKSISGQYLDGGTRQAVIDFKQPVFGPGDFDTVNKMAKSGGGTVMLPNGITIEVRLSGWSGQNGVIGYGEIVVPSASAVERLGVTEKQSKVAQQTAQATAKNERTK